MRCRSWLAALVIASAPRAAHAVCLGFLNQPEQGYKLEGNRLEPTGPKVAAGTELEFVGLGKFGDKFYLTRARSDVVFDSANVEVQGGCDLSDRALPKAK